MGNLCAGSEVEEADEGPVGPFHPTYEYQRVGATQAPPPGLEFTTGIKLGWKGPADPPGGGGKKRRSSSARRALAEAAANARFARVPQPWRLRVYVKPDVGYYTHEVTAATTAADLRAGIAAFAQCDNPDDDVELSGVLAPGGGDGASRDAVAAPGETGPPPWAPASLRWFGAGSANLGARLTSEACQARAERARRAKEKARFDGVKVELARVGELLGPSLEALDALASGDAGGGAGDDDAPDDARLLAFAPLWHRCVQVGELTPVHEDSAELFFFSD